MNSTVVSSVSRRTFLAGSALSLGVTLAGCLSSGESSGESNTATPSGPGTTATPTTTPPTDSPNEDPWFDLSRPGHYEFETYLVNDDRTDSMTVMLTIDVREGDAGMMTVKVAIDRSQGNDVSGSATAPVAGPGDYVILSQLETGTGDVEQDTDLRKTTLSVLAILELFEPAVEGRDLRVGNTWTWTPDNDQSSYEIEVVGTTTVAGIPCTQLVITTTQADDDYYFEAWVTGSGIATRTAVYVDGTLVMEIKLVR